MKLLVVLLVTLPLVMGGAPLEKMMQDMMGKDDGGDDRGGDMNWTGEGGDDKKDGGMAEQFKNWLMGESKKEEQKEMDKMEAMQKLAGFQKFVEKMKEKEMQAKKEKMALYKKMEAIKEKKKMIYDLKAMTEDFAMQKMKLKFGVFYQALTFCDCEDGLQILKRLKYGKFGSMEDEEDEDQGRDGDMGGNRNNTGGMGGDMGGNMGGGDMDGDMADFKNKSLYEAARYLKSLDKKERVKTILGHGYKVMCGAAKQYFKYLSKVEEKFRYLRQNYDM